MISIFIFLLIVVSVFLILVVLLQSSKGNGLAGPIGGSSVTMAFGVRRTSDILTKSSTILAAVLMVGCIIVNLLIQNKGTGDESIIQKNAGQQQQQQQMPPQNNLPPSDNTMPPSEDQNQNQNQEQTNPGGQTDQNQAPTNTTPQGK